MKKNTPAIPDYQLPASLVDSLLAQVPLGFAFFDREYRLLRVTSQFAEISGHSVGDYIGKTVRKITPAQAGTIEDLIDKVYELGKAVSNVEFTVEAPVNTGVCRHCLAGFFPIFNTDQLVEEVGCFMLEVTERKLIELEREQLLEKERAARQDVERANRMKDEFLATLSHELRTPLNAILGWAKLLQKKAKNLPPEIMKGLEVIEKNSRGQAQLIDDLLETSRIVSGKVRLEVQQVDLNLIAIAAIASIQPAADTKGIEVTVDDGEKEALTLGDPSRLQQVVWNLLSNAVKFTPAGGKISVQLRRAAEHFEVVIKDSGQGISPDFLPYVFDRFRQADSSARRSSGLGLGLSIVKQLTELHNGTVRVESEGEGKGATFIVSLPIRLENTLIHPEAAPRADAPDSPLYGEVSLKALRILVVDDEPDARELVKRILEECHAEVDTVPSVSDALQALQQKEYALLISDIGMPQMDGYDLIREVRAHSGQHAKIPALALTAFARAEDRTRALSSGYTSYMSKPIEPGALVVRVASLLGRA